MHLLLCGHGYLGHAIAREFSAAGWQVTPVSLHGGDGALSCDLSDAASVAALSAQVSPDFIVHCAASGKGGADAYRAVYLDGCRHLTETFPGIPLLFTSSTSVYAQTDGSEVTEESTTEPDRETGKILLETERHVLTHGGIVARLAGIYGPERSVILKKLLSGEAVIEEDGRRFLNQIHRDDAARAILHLAGTGLPGTVNRAQRDSPSDASKYTDNLPARSSSISSFQLSGVSSQLFNVSDNEPLTQLKCYQGLAELFQKPLPPSGPRDLNRKRGWTHKRVSNAKLRATGWQPKFPSFLHYVAALSKRPAS